MGLFCTERFKAEFEKLKNKKPYRGLEAEIIEYFVGAELSVLMSGTRLNGNNPNPYIKKRLEGSGGYRVYYLLISAKGDVYLIFVHPKTGPYGSKNIQDEAKAFCIKRYSK